MCCLNFSDGPHEVEKKRHLPVAVVHKMAESFHRERSWFSRLPWQICGAGLQVDWIRRQKRGRVPARKGKHRWKKMDLAPSGHRSCQSGPMRQGSGILRQVLHPVHAGRAGQGWSPVWRAKWCHGMSKNASSRMRANTDSTKSVISLVVTLTGRDSNDSIPNLYYIKYLMKWPTMGIPIHQADKRNGTSVFCCLFGVYHLFLRHFQKNTPAIYRSWLENGPIEDLFLLKTGIFQPAMLV